MCYLLCRNWSQISLKKRGGKKKKITTLFTFHWTHWKTQTNKGTVLGNSFTFLIGHSYFISCSSMDELKYLIYCLHKFIHVGDVYSLKCYTKATVIFADRAVWRCEASDGLRFPHRPNSVGSCCRSGTQALQQSWDCRTPLYPCQGSCGFRLPPSVLVLCLRRVLQPMCCQVAAGGAGRWIIMLQLEPN